VLALMLALPFGAQINPVLLQIQQPAGLQQGVIDHEDRIGEQRRFRAINAERQKSMVKDTDKLLRLARELNEEVNRPNSAVYDQAEYSKAAEIEKLAHRVKEKMSTSVGPAPDTLIPLPHGLR
jgi:hypothetical protein